MKTFVVLALDARKPKADGTSPVILRIIHHRKAAQIVTGIYLKEKDWDPQARVVKSSYRGISSVTRLNNQLQKKKTEALDIITKLDEKKVLDTYSLAQIKELIERKSDHISFFTYATSLIHDLNEANHVGNARAYQCAVAALKTFCNGRDLSFMDINYEFLNRFEIAHLKKGRTYNGLSAYLRAVRAMFNHAIRAKVIDKEIYPFETYQIKSTKTRKRAISMEAIKRIEELQLGPEHPLFDARNYFLISFYLRGISFSDLAELKVSDIIEGRIYYQRKKTDKPYNIKIIPQAQDILNHYLKGKTKNDYIFSIVKGTSVEEKYYHIQWSRKRFNKKLKGVAELCGIEENLTSYVSRHSFASRAKNLGIPITGISEMLGHENIKTTEIYLDTMPSDLLDDFHAQVVKQ